MTRNTTIMYDFFYLCSYSFFSSNLFNYRFPYCIHLYTWSTQQVIVAQHMCWFLKASIPPMFSPIKYFNFIPDGFPFSSIYGPPYPTFQSHLVLLPSDVLLALLLVDDLSHFCTIFYHNTVLGHVVFHWWLDPEEISPESWTTYEYCPDVIFCFVLSVPVFYSQIVLLSLHPIVGLPECIL